MTGGLYFNFLARTAHVRLGPLPLSRRLTEPTGGDFSVFSLFPYAFK